MYLMRNGSVKKLTEQEKINYKADNEPEISDNEAVFSLFKKTLTKEQISAEKVILRATKVKK